MAWIHPAAVEHRRKLYTRHDAWRFTPDGKMPGWLDPSATRVRLKEAQEEEAQAAFEAQVAELRASQERARELLAEIKYELAWRRLCRKYGYNPDQPRDELGRWTDAGGTAQSDSGDGSTESESDGQILSDETPDPVRPGSQYAQNEPQNRPIDLREEQQLGGHAIEGHVGKSQEFLLGAGSKGGAGCRARRLRGGPQGRLLSVA